MKPGCMPPWIKVVVAGLGLWMLALGVCAMPGAPGDVTPPEHRRGAEQTFLTYPEWFLVFSPAEYADFVRDHDPSDFPFLGHIGEFWQAYGAVYRATRDRYPMNWGYHAMIMVIGTSTTVEYGIRSAYETLVGRLTELTRTHGPAEEDRYAARVAQEYVDFIRVEPWYKFDFAGKLKGLWVDTALWGPDALRKWERKYALTTEYGVKAGYGWLIGKLTAEAYDAPLPVTAVMLDRMPRDDRRAMPRLQVLAREADGSVLATVPRYQAFTDYALVLANQGVRVTEVAGNRGPILVSLIVPTSWSPHVSLGSVLFTQPVLTRPGRRRLVLTPPVGSLTALLRAAQDAGLLVEHIYDY
ncbi:hypothetical protein [Rhodanobacter koreensis]